MARKNQLDASLPFLESFFDNSPEKAFTETKFFAIINRNIYELKIPVSKNGRQVLLYLVKRKLLKENVFNESKIIYTWKTFDEFTAVQGLKSNSYYAYYTSLYLHQLTLQIPKIIYLNFEHSEEKQTGGAKRALTQDAIDNAFSQAQRKSNLAYSFGDMKIIITNGKYSNKLGVIKRQNSTQCFEYTDLERTIIDISVRPVYAGGVFEVLEAYRIAKGKLDVKKMANYFERLNYLYPYHQVIGFYLEKAGYKENETVLFKKKQNFDFYLTYAIRNMVFSEKWRLFYPKGF